MPMKKKKEKSPTVKSAAGIVEKMMKRKEKASDNRKEFFEEQDKVFENGEPLNEDPDTLFSADSIGDEQPEKIDFGFSFEADEGRAGEVNRDIEGDLTPEQRAQGNLFQPSLSTGDPGEYGDTAEETVNMHVTDEEHAGLGQKDEPKGKDRK